MTKVIPLNSPNLVGNEMRYLKDCINTNWISTSGKYIKSFLCVDNGCLLSSLLLSVNLSE